MKNISYSIHAWSSESRMADISKEYKQYKRAKLLYQELCKKYRAVCLRLNEEYEYGSTSSPIEIYQSDDWNIK